MSGAECLMSNVYGLMPNVDCLCLMPMSSVYVDVACACLCLCVVTTLLFHCVNLCYSALCYYALCSMLLCSMLCSMQAFMRSRRCWFSDIVSQGTISRVCPFKLAARTLSLVKQMEYLRHQEKIIIHTNQVNSLEVYSARTLNPLK